MTSKRMTSRIERALHTGAAFLLALALTQPALAGSGTIAVKDGAGVVQTFDVTTDGIGNYLAKQVICDQSAGANCATVSGNALKVDGSAATQPVSAASLPLPTGASSAALQSAVQTPIVPAGASATAGLLLGGQYNATQATFTDGQQGAIQITSRGALLVATGADALTATARVVGNAGATLDAVVTAATAPANGLAILGVYNSALPTPSTGQSVALQLDAKGNLRGVLMDGAGNARSANVNASSQLSVSCDNGCSSSTPAYQAPVAPTTATATGSVVLGGQYNSTQATFTNTQQGSLQISSRGELKINLMDASGAARGANVDSSNRLSVSLDNVSASNISTNVAQINGITPLMGNGSTGTGSQRVTIAADNSAVAGLGAGATGAGVPSNAIYSGANVGGNTTGMIACGSTAIYDASTSGSTQLVALSSGKIIYICGYSITTGATATNVKLVYGTGSNCVTGATAITPAFQLAANSGIVDHAAYYTGLATIASNELCINTSAGNAVQAIVYYTQF